MQRSKSWTTPLQIVYELPADLEGTILESIMEKKVHEIVGSKAKLPAAAIEHALAERAPEIRSLRRALLSASPAVIAEIKKGSPSAGILRADLDPVQIAAEYGRGGAAAISIVTEVHHFYGNLECLAQLRWTRARLPLLRKDFLIDPYQLLESRLCGADAVLLIAALVDQPALLALRERAESLGLEALVEVHDERELERALAAGATLVGVNNRDLRTFEVSIDTALRLGPRIPKEVVSVAESGITSATDIHRLSEAGYRGFLIGEHFMRAPSPGHALSTLISHSRVGGRKVS